MPFWTSAAQPQPTMTIPNMVVAGVASTIMGFAVRTVLKWTWRWIRVQSRSFAAQMHTYRQKQQKKEKEKSNDDFDLFE